MRSFEYSSGFRIGEFLLSERGKNKQMQRKNKRIMKKSMGIEINKMVEFM